MSFLNWRSFTFKLSFTNRGHSRGIVLHKSSSHRSIAAESLHKSHHVSAPIHKPHTGLSPIQSFMSNPLSGSSITGRRNW